MKKFAEKAAAKVLVICVLAIPSIRDNMAKGISNIFTVES